MKSKLITNSVLKNSQISYFNISKESLKLIIDSLESEEIETLLQGLYEFLYEDKEPIFNSKMLISVWNHIISTGERLSKGYLKKIEVARENGKKGGRPKKSILQDNNFESDFNNERKPDLSQENNQCDNLYHPKEESALNEPKTALNEVIETNDINNNSIDNNMGNYLGTLEEIEEKCKNNFKADLSHQNYKDDNLYHPKGESVLNRPKTALNQKIEVKLSGNKDEFNKILKDYEFTLQDIIKNINSDYEFKRRIGYKDLEEFINQTLRGKYESELKEYINTYIKK